jgi:5'-3' exonuclease
VKALIDGDVVAYRCAAAGQHIIYRMQLSDGTVNSFKSIKEFKEFIIQKEYVGMKAIPYDEKYIKLRESLYEDLDIDPVGHVLHSVKQVLKGILKSTHADEYTVFLTGEDQWRPKIFPDYKISRRDRPKPYYLARVREYMCDWWNAQIIQGDEADDAMAIAQMADPNEDTIICTIDKDLLMVPGLHYNFVKGESQCITKEEGMRHFYKQLLAGDRVDDIPGIYGIGMEKADKLLPEDWSSEMDLWLVAKDLLHEEGFSLEDIIIHGKLLWMKRSPDDEWLPPVQE